MDTECHSFKTLRFFPSYKAMFSTYDIYAYDLENVFKIFGFTFKHTEYVNF